MRSQKVYVALLVLFTALFYLVPYTLYVGVRGFTLFTYWSLLTLLWIAITLIYLRRWG
ncbi:MAG: hypothetical protein NZ911_04985 [Sulfolobales archaeon]|nr:hypothetical protein [Sulfolobales archaeon]